ncbi:DUF748 domain-containing protein [Microbulbifer magnicolonia]|uniref:DUF748 domain-containing protein n=1 Tax=Microbulbifer magnicolonia TaxID=3109744 RepID=UPI002B40C294|nr:DUF748 domain-containing protein [Microbulbifer sp. GG15]
MPQTPTQPTDSIRRLLWWLVGGLLLLGAASIAASTILTGKIEQWLAQRGLESDIDYLQVSIPRLQLIARGVRARNSDGRGFHAREVMLDYSWWQLLRGRWRLQRAYLDGAAFDLESVATERGRQWEVGGWALGQGERRDRDFELLLDWVRIRDSRLCYRHLPVWPTPSCVRFGDLQSRDFLLAMQRSGDEPLQLTIGADELSLRDLLASEKDAPTYNTALVELDLSAGRFVRPGNRITAERVAVGQFGSCPPQRWAEALPGLGRLIGHCGTARRLQLEGELLFSFGGGAEVRWRRASGQGIQLRHSDRRWQNWRAESLAMRDFDYVREQQRLRWQSAGASAFDWCPDGLRNRDHHHCVRAGTLQLPDPVTFDWSDRLTVAAGPSRLQQVQLLDVAGQNRDPLTAHLALFGALTYSGKTRTLEFASIDLESASGCVPGQLWQQPDTCVRLIGLHAAEPLQLRFAARAPQQPWGFASGPLRLAQFRAKRDNRPQLQLQQLHWQRINLVGTANGAEAPLLLQDFGLQSLSGCLPAGILPTQGQPLCAEVQSLAGRGNFAWQGGSEGYAILGELRLQRLLLSDQLDGDRGLLLEQLHTGEGFMRRDADVDHPWIDTDQGAPVAATVTPPPPPVADIGDEKGLLPQELARHRGRDSTGAADGIPVPDVANPNLHLQRSSLTRLQGCLPVSWARLLYSQPQQMPGCFDLRNLRQQSPLAIAWQGGLDLAAGQLTLERALAKTPREQTLLDLSELRLPDARIRILPAPQRSIFLSLPDFSLQALHFCLPETVPSLALDSRCADVQKVRAGKDWQLSIDSQQVAADFSGTLAERILLTGGGDQVVAEVQQLLAPQLQIRWSRSGERAAKLDLHNVSAAAAFACLPQDSALRAGLPRCVATSDLRTVGASGLALGETLFKAAPVAEPLWRIDALAVERVSLTPDTLGLHGLDIRQLLFCGLHELLPEDAGTRGIADCISAKRLQFAGTSRIGLTPAAARVELGRLVTEPVAFWQEGAGEYLQAGFRRLSWQRLSWDGGPLLWVTDLQVAGLRGCAAGPVQKVTLELLEDVAERALGNCYGLRRLHLPGTQKISLAAPFSTDGSVEMVGLSIGRGSGAPLEIAQVQLDQLAFGGAPLGRLSGARGCLAPGMFGDSRLAPCYRFGRVELQSVERVDTPFGRTTLLHGLEIDGIELSQPDYAQALPAQLLQVESFSALRLLVGAGEIDAQQLELEGIASCIPRGYLPRLDHCFALDKLMVSGSYITSDERFAMSRVQLQGVQVLSGDGRGLVRGESVTVEQLLSDRTQFRFLRAEAADFEFFDRREDAPEYERHSVIGRLAGLQVDQLGYDRIARRLDIARVDALRPRLILMRDRAGEYPFLQELAALTGADQTPLVRAAEAVTEALQFRYLIHEFHVRHGTFTWVDRQGQFRARLPIRAIYLTMRNTSNLPEHPPATVLLNGRPGGFGEIQLAGTIDYLDTRKWNADLTGYIVNTNLIPATPYMAQLLGYKVLQGQLNATLDIRVRENAVQAHADMELERIRVRRVRDEDQIPVKSTFIPLNVALILLRDGNGDVRFRMPIRGDLYDPKFSFSYIFSDLLQKAIMEALFSYFTPIGFYTLAKFAWGRFRAVHFDPILFAPGSAELDADAREQLQEMLATLRERPDARPGICGISNPRDWHALYPGATPGLGGSRRARESFYRHPPLMLFEEFERLALERSRQIERYLLDAGISAAELIPCAPDYNGRDFGQPRVEFSN